MKPSYHLSKLQKLVFDEAKIYQEKRSELVTRLGEDRPPTPCEAKQGQTGPFVKAEHMPAFLKGLEELSAVPVSIAWGPFDLSALGEDGTVAAADLNALGLHTDGALVVMPEEAPTKAAPPKARANGRGNTGRKVDLKS